MHDDKGMRLVSWYAVAASVLLLIFFCIWGAFGKIPKKITGDGVLCSGAGSIIIYSPVDGIISDVSVYLNMNILQNDTIVRIETAEGEIVKVSSPHPGRVASLEITQDKPVRAGVEIGRILIQSDNADFLAVVCYIPLADAGKIIPGMEMEIYPDGVDTDSTGHMDALVQSLSKYPPTKSEIAFDVGSDIVAEEFLKKSPLIAVKGVLLKDPGSQNSYRWSNPNGGSVKITDGMLIQANIVAGYESPFILIMPFLKGIIFGGNQNE